MAATVKTYGYTGVAVAGEPTTSAEIVDTLRHKCADNNANDIEKPCWRPDAGYNFGWWKSIGIENTTPPPSEISGVIVYADNTLGWADCTVFFGVDNSDKFSDTYVQATGDDVSGDEMVANHSEVDKTLDLFDYTEGSPMSVELSPSYGAQPTTGRMTKFIVVQLRLGASAVGGVQPSEIIIFEWDEV